MTLAGRRRLAAAALSALALGGCADLMRPPRVGPPAPQLSDRKAEKRYQQVLGSWTRRAEIYDGLDSRLFVAATFQAMAFREAKAERVAAIRSLPAPEAQALLVAQRKEHDEALELMLAVHSNERRFDDLSRPESVWRLALVSEAGEAEPLSVEKLPRPDANLRALYPYLDTYWTGYRVHFPRTFANGAQVLPQKAQTVLVRLSSSLGKAELRWDLAAPPPVSGAIAWP